MESSQQCLQQYLPVPTEIAIHIALQFPEVWYKLQLVDRRVRQHAQRPSSRLMAMKTFYPSFKGTTSEGIIYEIWYNPRQKRRPTSLVITDRCRRYRNRRYSDEVQLMVVGKCKCLRMIHSNAIYVEKLTRKTFQMFPDKRFHDVVFSLDDMTGWVRWIRWLTRITRGRIRGMYSSSFHSLLDYREGIFRHPGVTVTPKQERILRRYVNIVTFCNIAGRHIEFEPKPRTSTRNVRTSRSATGSPRLADFHMFARSSSK